MITDMRGYLGKGAATTAEGTVDRAAYKKRMRRVHALSLYVIAVVVIFKLIITGILAFNGGRKFERRRLARKGLIEETEDGCCTGRGHHHGHGHHVHYGAHYQQEETPKGFRSRFGTSRRTRPGEEQAAE